LKQTGYHETTFFAEDRKGFRLGCSGKGADWDIRRQEKRIQPLEGKASKINLTEKKNLRITARTEAKWANRDLKKGQIARDRH